MEKETRTETVARLEKAIPLAQHHMVLLWLSSNEPLAFEVKATLEKMERELTALKKEIA